MIVSATLVKCNLLERIKLTLRQMLIKVSLSDKTRAMSLTNKGP